MKAKDFQESSAQYIADLFERGHQHVLLADEVGLGKTIVSSRVVELMKKGKQSFKVVYVCSNQSIISQNAEKLGIERNNVFKLSESRLSTQHLTLFEKKNQKEYLIPITPSTSLDVTKGYGNAYERALIYSLIEEDFQGEEKELLMKYLDVYARFDKKGKFQHTFEFRNGNVAENRFKKNKDCGQSYSHYYNQYYTEIRQKLKAYSDYQEAINSIRQNLPAVIQQEAESENTQREPKRPGITVLRNIFCEISLSMLEPDLVIMDEFQRYNDLIKAEDTEQKRLADRLFNTGAKILLVSATPYKPYDTMDGLKQEGEKKHFEEFMLLIKFLMGNQEYAKFKVLWSEYSSKLSSISQETIGRLLETKKEAENLLRNYIVRTERYQPNLASTSTRLSIEPTEDDVESYVQMRTLLKEAASNKKTPSFNVDYTKSSPYLLSFMADYTESRFLKEAIAEGFSSTNTSHLLLDNDNIIENQVQPDTNARLKALCEQLFNDMHNSAKLLWVPASKPYYKTKGIYYHCSDFSKYLVFSKWGFVPRMISTMLSMIARQKTEYNTKEEEGKSEHNALYEYRELLLSPFCHVADHLDFNLDNYKGQDIKKIRKSIKEKIKGHIRQKVKRHKVKENSTILLGLMKLLNGEEIERATKLVYNDRILSVLADIIIASPGICLYRCFKDDYISSIDPNYFIAKQKSESAVDAERTDKIVTLFTFAKSFVSMLGNSESEAIIKGCTSDAPYYTRVLEYCVEGNLQAMFDEYAYVLGYAGKKAEAKQDLWEKMDRSIINRSTLEIDTQESFFGNSPKKKINIWYACDFANQKNSNDKIQERKTNVQTAFNSPFRPFVLASTSVGQEGLDFHLYCRKIVHWNIPANPVNYEQRSGRINRYEGLAIRRSLAHLFPDYFTMDKIVKAAEENWKQSGYNNMVPHWCLPKEVIEDDNYKNKLEPIENIFLCYPASVDDEFIDDLMEKQKLYRLTMGQPDQEFVIDLLRKANLDDNKRFLLMFNFTPSSYK